MANVTLHQSRYCNRSGTTYRNRRFNDKDTIDMPRTMCRSSNYYGDGCGLLSNDRTKRRIQETIHGCNHRDGDGIICTRRTIDNSNRRKRIPTSIPIVYYKLILILVTLLLLSGCSMTEAVTKERSFLVEFVSWIFSDVLKYILFTPFEFFKSDTSISIVIRMGVFSAGFVTILAMVEGFKRMLSMDYTPMSRVFVRYPIALCVSAFAPTIFYYAGYLTNELVKYMGILTGSSLEGTDSFNSLFHEVGYHTYEAALTFFMLVILIFYFLRILMFHAIRWFGLMFNMVMTPIAMTAFMFRPYENVFSGWMKDSISKFSVVVAHSFFLGLIAIILYAPNIGLSNTIADSFWESTLRTLMSIGGLHMMLHPPGWIISWFDKGKDIRQGSGMIKRLIQLAIMKRG